MKIIKAKQHLSASQVSDYMRCPGYYAMKHILKIPSLDKPKMILGSALHSAFQDYLYNKDEAGISELKITFQNDMACLIKTRKIFWKSSPEIEACLLRDDGLKMIDAYYPTLSTFEPLKDKTGLWIEKEGEIHFQNVDWSIKCRLDLATKEKNIIDYKITSLNKDVDDYYGDIQMGIYMMFYRNYFKDNPKGIWIDTLSVVKGNGRFIRIVLDMSRLQVLQLPAIFNKVRQGILGGVFFPNRSKWKCMGCEYKLPCESEAWNIN